MNQDMIFQRFERFWHWLQAILIILLLITGFNVHDSFRLLSFAGAAQYHVVLAWALIALWVLAVYWHFVTGQWRQYIPENRNQVLAMVHYYAVEIFLSGGHPFHRSRQHKHNPLQGLTYLAVLVGAVPVIWGTGWIYLYYVSWGASGLGESGLGYVAALHTAAAFAILVFLVIHLYLAFTVSDTPLGNLKAMITGYQDDEEDEHVV